MIQQAILLTAVLGYFQAYAYASVAHSLRECPREKSENLGVLANKVVCKNDGCEKQQGGKKFKGERKCMAKTCENPEIEMDMMEGMFIDEEYIKCNSQRSDMCNKRGIKGEIRFRLRKNCVQRNKAKRYDFTVHIKIPESRALPVTTKSTIKVHGLPENNTKAWLSPLGEEIIFNINDVSWKDLAVFLKRDEKDVSKDLIVRRGFSIAPLSQDKNGFQATHFPELNFARNGSSEIIDDDESAFFICKQDHVQENIVTVAFWHQKIFTGIVMKGHAHSITYKMAAVLGGFVLAGIMLCLFSALLTLKKQSNVWTEEHPAEAAAEEAEEAGAQDKDHLISCE
jgi:hypothetical protein